ncbi:formate dehydrogenase accessory sulfurtransferase FdhD [Flavobacterium sp. MC2016-06]|jgi:FdhD protein|uniref:formate dehydrogenase accessory sulfurtransferase FdhD n=1 Tax=Flavobacterium sp. MC2016-06 TaxID=2676308 RepID=UPI0012BAA449|nr:formate dehydrogenase accessory sulfurtransferase FdhD [Flavobacterium sp. MC2016-06]MBU3861444.1 formate dehydrogenase accessory sulfurtransferase FdhD [Flavobacterium sp. MC2016-06]
MEINDPEVLSIKNVIVKKVNGITSSSSLDALSIEEPLEIRIVYGPSSERVEKNISVTMRTPGDDLELAIGFLFTEGIISSYNDIKNASHLNMACTSFNQNIFVIELQENFVPKLMQSDRNFYTTSSCGVCGKGSIASIKTVSSFKNMYKPQLSLSVDVLYRLSEKLRTAQSNFVATGGIHASGLFTIKGDLIMLKEDVGRHNALDKLIGSALADNLLPLNEHILLLSGRASFELIQKAAMAGISIIVSIGAPSSLAVEMASEFDITLLGFLKENRFNIYNSSDTTVIPTVYEN